MRMLKIEWFCNFWCLALNESGHFQWVPGVINCSESQFELCSAFSVFPGALCMESGVIWTLMFYVLTSPLVTILTF